MAFSDKESSELQALVRGDELSDSEYHSLYNRMACFCSEHAKKLAGMLNLQDLAGNFAKAPSSEKTRALLGILKLITGSDRMADLSGIGGSKCEGCIQPSFTKELNSRASTLVFIDQSATGMFEKRQRLEL